MKNGGFSCFEVTIGWYGRERVDYITYDHKGVWKFYEIKSSLQDFNSPSNITFLGHYNYYVMPKDLFEQVKDKIPSHVGVYVDGKYIKKRAKKQDLGIDEQILKDSMIRSLYREAEKLIKSNTPSIVEGLRRRLNREIKEKEEYRQKYYDLMNIGYKKYGPRWYKEESDEV